MAKSKNKFKFIDLFAGIGGFHHALSAIGGECVMTCELDTECQKTYKATFPKAGKKFPLISNIREITRVDSQNEDSLRSAIEINKLVPDHDMLCGGFPCQPFSKSGEQRGVLDKTRGTLFFDILQIIEAKKPRYIFLENVRNLAGPRHTDTWATIIENLKKQGYKVSEHPLIFSPHLLPTHMGGAPQVRERVFILGVRLDEESNNVLNVAIFNEYLIKQKFWNPEKWQIKDYLQNDSEILNIEKYNISEDENIYLEAWNYFVENIELDKLPGFPIWAFAFKSKPEIESSMPQWKKTFLTKNSDFYNENKKFLDNFLSMKWGERKLKLLDFPYSRQILEWQAKKQHPKRKGRTLKDLVIQFRPSGIRVKPATYLPALVAITQTSVVGPKLRFRAKNFRKLTLVEAGRLQGIPDHVYASGNIADKHAYKQLGNAVNVGIIRATASVFMGLEFFEPQKEDTQLNFF